MHVPLQCINEIQNPFLYRGVFQVIQEEEILQTCIETSLTLNLQKGIIVKQEETQKEISFIYNN